MERGKRKNVMQNFVRLSIVHLQFSQCAFFTLCLIFLTDFALRGTVPSVLFFGFWRCSLVCLPTCLLACCCWLVVLALGFLSLTPAISFCPFLRICASCIFRSLHLWWRVSISSFDVIDANAQNFLCLLMVCTVPEYALDTIASQCVWMCPLLAAAVVAIALSLSPPLCVYVAIVIVVFVHQVFVFVDLKQL